MNRPQECFFFLMGTFRVKYSKKGSGFFDVRIRIGEKPGSGTLVYEDRHKDLIHYNNAKSHTAPVCKQDEGKYLPR